MYLEDENGNTYTAYIHELSDAELMITPGETKEIDTYFKIAQVKKYDISIEDTAGESTEGFMDTAMSAITLFISAIQLLFVL